MAKTANPPRVIFVGFDGLQLLDLAGPADVFSIANMHRPGAYDVSFAGTVRSVRANNGLPFSLTSLPTVSSIDTVVVPGGFLKFVFGAIGDKELMAWLRDAASHAYRTASICSGAFVLASLGLLDRKRCVTHWVGIDRLADYAPKAIIEKDAILVEDGNIWTSAGVTAGIDLALAMVRRDHGDELAVQVARDIVVQMMRPGNQSQYSTPLALQRKTVAGLENLIPWLESRLGQPTSVPEMADAVGMSERQFHRQCVAQLGRTPARLALELKLDHARNLLQDERLPVGVVAEICGFASSETFSKTFKKQFGISPMTFRKHWAEG